MEYDKFFYLKDIIRIYDKTDFDELANLFLENGINILQADYENHKMHLNDNPDAREWAKEFIKTIQANNIPLVFDEDFMTTWFANAIMCGYDYAYKEMNKR